MPVFKYLPKDKYPSNQWPNPPPRGLWCLKSGIGTDLRHTLGSRTGKPGKMEACIWVIPCEKSKKKHDNFFWFLTLKVKSIWYFSDKNNFFDNFCWFSYHFQIFFRKSQLLWKLQKWKFLNNVLLFFYCSKVS